MRVIRFVIPIVIVAGSLVWLRRGPAPTREAPTAEAKDEVTKLCALQAPRLRSVIQVADEMGTEPSRELAEAAARLWRLEFHLRVEELVVAQENAMLGNPIDSINASKQTRADFAEMIEENQARVTELRGEVDHAIEIAVADGHTPLATPGASVDVLTAYRWHQLAALAAEQLDACARGKADAAIIGGVVLAASLAPDMHSNALMTLTQRILEPPAELAALQDRRPR